MTSREAVANTMSVAEGFIHTYVCARVSYDRMSECASSQVRVCVYVCNASQSVDAPLVGGGSCFTLDFPNVVSLSLIHI